METAQKKRIGILTGGGDCPGLNAVIRAACLTCISHDYELVGLHDGFEGLYEEAYTILDSHKVANIYGEGGTILGTTNIGHYCLPLSEDTIKRTVETYNKLGLQCLICIGGDGTMSIAYVLSQHGVNVVGVPKTIDNDLMATDVTFGFDSAVSVVTDALDRLQTTAASHHRVMVVEVMGRNAGWIALASGVAGGANVILLPEIRWEWESIFATLKARAADKGKRYSLVVVAEGCVPPGSDSQITADDEAKKAVRLGGIGKYVSDRIAKDIGMDTRYVILGHVQRGGSPTSYDRILATKYGSMAAKLAIEGTYGYMASLKGTEVVKVPITAEMREQRKVNPKTDQMVWAARNVGTVFGDEHHSS
ncbi:6-phosphofructokinase precursor family protein [Acanthamoeba castellanii str. Neff]|uniref:6-phosphofructokinase n=2 Tax=Acanthamoeba castellanii TaxID=5755 RepID=L8H3K6_ACACF|nr:6-phosphofructokinase precursor family protein [Acanthamoeba castellanii str. Neff]ELR19790.1 6-phosphofructokinase precursor family protein [Acanthamoeba castellanii str. Neff]